MEFVTMVVGDEMSQLVELKGYVGEDTIAYRSTKVRHHTLFALPFPIATAQRLSCPPATPSRTHPSGAVIVHSSGPGALQA